MPYAFLHRDRRPSLRRPQLITVRQANAAHWHLAWCTDPTTLEPTGGPVAVLPACGRLLNPLAQVDPAHTWLSAHRNHKCTSCDAMAGPLFTRDAEVAFTPDEETDADPDR